MNFIVELTILIFTVGNFELVEVDWILIVVSTLPEVLADHFLNASLNKHLDALSVGIVLVTLTIQGRLILKL